MCLKRSPLGCLPTIVFAVIGIASRPALAQVATYDFDILAQSPPSALEVFGRTCNQQLVFDKSLLANKQSTALAGRFSAEEGTVGDT
jgi:hypothetical protein